MCYKWKCDITLQDEGCILTYSIPEDSDANLNCLRLWDLVSRNLSYPGEQLTAATFDWNWDLCCVGTAKTNLWIVHAHNNDPAISRWSWEVGWSHSRGRTLPDNCIQSCECYYNLIVLLGIRTGELTDIVKCCSVDQVHWLLVAVNVT
jgi:hypothetical protein